MRNNLGDVKAGLLLVMIGLLFGIGMGIGFGVNEDAFKDFVAETVAVHPELHDADSAAKIWRYAQRAHFHATGIAAFSLGLIFLIMMSNLKPRLRQAAAILVGIGGLYPLSWFAMFYLAPSIGRGLAHDHLLTEALAWTGVGGLLAGLVLIIGNLFFGLFANRVGD